MQRPILSLIVLVSLAFGAPALAQVTTTIKTPPLSDSDSFILPINIHIPVVNPPFAGWAGAVVSVHLLDGSEMDVVSVTALPPFAASVLTPGGNLLVPQIPSPFGPPSANLTSAPLPANFFLPTASASGVAVGTSTSFTVATAF